MRSPSEPFPDSSTQIVEAIWPTSSVVCREESHNSSVLPLRTFIQETLRRSRTSYSTLQVALYYLVLIKDRLPERDFTMEQLDDCHASRALQCGRRMFLAALILASKYLQDRNYSARAWSKISGLNTQEINQNEMAFLLAVNWNLHITEQVYHRWTDSVMKHSPSQPPGPGSGLTTAEFEQQCEFFKRIVRCLNPDLENLDDALAVASSVRFSPVPSLSPRSLSPRSILAAAQDERTMCTSPFEYGSRDTTPTPMSAIYQTPSIMEPSPSSLPAVGRLAPSFGLLPTPRLTPQLSAIRDPSPPQLLSSGSAMGMALNTAGSVQSGMILDKWPGSITSSPQGYFPRRSSLANSVSTASSPESMVSDLSGTSRSSSISSISSLASAPYSKFDCHNLEVQARCRSAKLLSERYVARPVIASSSEDYATSISSSPQSYTGMGQEPWACAVQTAKREFEVDDAANDAARALQELRENWHRSSAARSSATSAPKAGSKRTRPRSIDHGLQDNVRELLRTESLQPEFQIPAASVDGRKRVCYSAEAAHFPLPTFEGPGMWAGILN